MVEAQGSPNGPVTAADVEHAVRLALAALRGADAPDWSVKAGSLEWDCWETVEHLADDLFSYAVQLGPANPPLDTHVPSRGIARGRAALLMLSSQTVRPAQPVCYKYLMPAAPC